MTAQPTVLDFLLTRRSRPAKLLTEPGPDEAQLMTLLAAATRVPDHGKLEPWRFVIIQGAARALFARKLRARADALGLEPEKSEKAASCFETSPLVVVVIASPKPSEKIPEIEQTLSAGAVCLSLVNAALASGWGACWLSGWPAYDGAIQEALALEPQEWISGFIHIGTASAIPPERPRPDIASLVTRFHG